jgi:ribosomal protein S1
MINFPASSNMTDFEIVEIDNERSKIKARKRAVEFRANQERERQINQKIDKGQTPN